MRPPNAEQVAVMVCDDVRAEQGGRFSYMGVLGPSLGVQQVPCVVPSLCCAVLLLNPREAIRSMTSTLYGPDGRIIFQANEPIAQQPAEPHLLSIAMKLCPVLLRSLGDHRFVLTFNGTDEIGFERHLVVRPPNEAPSPATRPPVPQQGGSSGPE